MPTAAVCGLMGRVTGLDDPQPDEKLITLKRNKEREGQDRGPRSWIIYLHLLHLMIFSGWTLTATNHNSNASKVAGKLYTVYLN